MALPTSSKTNPEEILYGTHPVRSALLAGKRQVYEVLVTAGRRSRSTVAPVLDLATRNKRPVVEISDKQMTALAGSEKHQGLAARVSPFVYTHRENLAQTRSASGRRLLLILDGITDPQNLGALIRTAVCLGLTGIVIPKDNTASATPVVSKASAGAMEFASIGRETNLARMMDGLKKENFWIAGLAAQADKMIYECDLSGSMALVMGSEGKGLRRLIKQKCDFLMAIPQTATISSLNVSVAAGIAMYELSRLK